MTDADDQSETVVGHVHLVWSMYLPEKHRGSGEMSSPEVVKDELLEWITHDFLCGGHFPSLAIELVSSTVWQVDCVSSNDDWSSYPPAIIWNTPTATASPDTTSKSDHTFYTWNATYPVYEWGVRENVQDQLQQSLDDLISSDQLEAPWKGAVLSVMGQEEQSFSNIRMQYLTIDPNVANTVEYIGLIALIAHTLFLLVVYAFGKVFAKRQKAKNLVDRDDTDDLLSHSRDQDPPSQVFTKPHRKKSTSRRPQR
eukprot:scaffold818_cov136-Cylindrotheca_fusiformis.AAC.56